VRPTCADDGTATDTTGYQWPWWAGPASLAVPSAVLATALLFQSGGNSPQGAARWVAAGLVLLPWVADLRGTLTPGWLRALWVWAPIIILGHHDSSSAAWFLLIYLVGQVATIDGARTSVPVFLAAEVTLLVETLTTPSGVRWDTWLGWFLGAEFAAVGGWIWRRQHTVLAELRAAQAGLAERVTLAERQRIAREVHDVVAHSLTVTLLHITGARMAIRSDPEEAAEALAEAERVGRQSLDDVRRTVGLLAPAGADGTAPPLPGLHDLDGLVAGYTAAGARVRLDVDGDPATVSAATGLCLYRIAQESLANASRHAPGNPIEIQLSISAQQAVLRVHNPGNGTAERTPAGAPGGRGIPGMRERVAAVGGRLRAGEQAGAWLVEATVPLINPSAAWWRPGCH